MDTRVGELASRRRSPAPQAACEEKEVDQEEARALIDNFDIDSARQLVTAVAAELDGLAAQVWAFGFAEGPRRRALAIVAQMGAELAVGASQLFEAKRWYAGAALVIEYLLFLFATDPDEPVRWIDASEAEVRRMFRPAEMRRRAKGRFRAEEYIAEITVIPL
jgi:hypothetical protein